MLTVPAAIQSLYKTDGVRKNFRAHFPNGEQADITNADVVRESLHFTESVCSQNTFKFGLAEASLIEFETVGRANMMGMVIECGIEIDTSSLSAAQISAIQSSPGDGTLVLASASDIGFGYYRIPLGVFQVTSCPRDHQAMTHRRVTAIGELSPYNPFETAKENTYVPEKDYKPNAYLLALEMLGWQNKAGILAQGFTEQAVTEWRPTSGSLYIDLEKNVTLKDAGGNDLTFTTYIGFYYGAYQATPTLDKVTDMDMLYAADLHGVDYGKTLTDAKTALQGAGVNLVQSGFTSWDDLTASVFSQDLTGTPYLVPGVVYERVTVGSLGVPEGTLCPISGDNDAIYPYVGASVDKNNQPITQARFFMPTSFAIYETTGGTFTQVYDRNITHASISVYIPDAPVPILTLAVGETASVGLRKGLVKYNAYAHGGNFEPEKIPEGLLEFRGMFARLDRTGTLDMFALSSSSPAAVIPGDYMECWWDEYDVSPIGTVLIAYLNGEEGETEAEISLSTGRSIYDMTDNAVLKSLAAANAGTISVYLGREFKTHAAATGFTPAEMTMQAWPWMEAGDALRITAEDATTIDTFALQLDITGIQDLRAEIISQGGEIIGEV